MSLLNKITEDLNTALKSKDKVKVSTLRFLIAGVHNARIAKGEELSDEEVVVEIGKEVKRHRESIEAYEKGARGDLVAKEKDELAILEKYLPEQLSNEEISKIVDQAIVQMQASSLFDMGRVMGIVMTKVKGKADPVMVSRIVKEKLQSNN